MTSAHRATYKAAAGGTQQGGSIFIVSTRQYSAKDIQGHRLVKDRKHYQKNYDEIIGNKEAETQEIKSQLGIGPVDTPTFKSRETRMRKNSRTEEDSETSQMDKPSIVPNSQKHRPEVKIKNSKEQRDQRDMSDVGDEDVEDEDMAEVLREYQRLEKEKNESKVISNAKKSELQSQINEDAKHTLRKRWHQDTIFQNQSTKDKDSKSQHSNDLLRSDKHKKLLRRYILT